MVDQLGGEDGGEGLSPLAMRIESILLHEDIETMSEPRAMRTLPVRLRGETLQLFHREAGRDYRVIRTSADAYQQPQDSSGGMISSVPMTIDALFSDFDDNTRLSAGYGHVKIPLRGNNRYAAFIDGEHAYFVVSADAATPVSDPDDMPSFAFSG